MNVSVSNTEDLLMLIVTAQLTDREKNKKSDGQFFVDVFKEALECAGEKPSPTRAHVLGAFLDATKARRLDAVLWEVRRATGDRDAEKWFGAHAEEDARFGKFVGELRKSSR